MANKGIFFGAGPDADIVDDWTISALPTPPSPDADHDRLLESIAPEDWLKCWSALDDRARLVIDDMRTLLCADRRGRTVLRPGGGLRLRDSRVEPANAEDLPAFEDLIESRTSLESLGLKGSHGRGHLIVQASKICERRGKTLIGLAIRVVGRSFSPRWADLKQAFHLTQSENQVVKSLLSGLSAEQIAEAHGLSLDTIRTHIRHAYDKLNVSSRDQMWHRLAPYRLN